MQTAQRCSMPICRLDAKRSSLSGTLHRVTTTLMSWSQMTRTVKSKSDSTSRSIELHRALANELPPKPSFITSHPPISKLKNISIHNVVCSGLWGGDSTLPRCILICPCTYKLRQGRHLHLAPPLSQNP